MKKRKPNRNRRFLASLIAKRILKRPWEISLTDSKPAMFITFRAADSMPAEVIERFHQELKLWLKQNDLPDELANPPRQRRNNVAGVVLNCGLLQDAIGTIAATDCVPPIKLVEFKKGMSR